ncbi:acyl-CoA dehydrogenase family member 10 [Oenanthe melanoleuca]|uniref:acyl-CoA dehydrogenase family member 10 n=1 Tax=Oenanthe melanoleuca TaxID=2939378 RepID=UPI0024C1207C|nr:acyl-CoA dehydrogenase family member 10 [Oenanthe melanoleuca]XP_056360669.1 acyl-CoA dehydrogenase family member 10 [Oenanthe melanoleuca]XP_056360670.1 acyl-CoA dehydrogenase family member 10 [Oenanthe melanoleuca]
MYLRGAARAQNLLCAGIRQLLLSQQQSRGFSYKAVIFEESGVLLPAPHRTATGWEARSCIPAGTIQQAALSGGDNSLSLQYSRGELTAVEFLQELGQQCFEIANARVPVHSFLWDLIRNEMIKQLPIMAEAAQCIRAEGLKTALLSHNLCLGDAERSLPLDQQLFDVMVESHQEGMPRPSPGIYKLCLEHLGVQPQESILLDSSSQNLKAAAQLGMKTVKVDDPEAALKELETHLGFPLRGFVPYTRSVRPGMEIPKDRLQKYLEDVLGAHPTAPLELRQFDHGESTRSYLVKFGGRLLVLKKEEEPPDGPSGLSIPKEYRVLKALAEAGVPVPPVLALCEDRSILGTPFCLLEHRAGHIPRAVSLPAAPLRRRSACYSAMAQTLASIHRLQLGAATLQDLGEHGNYIQQQVETWTKHYRAVETHVIPAMERLIQWLPLHFPESQKTTVVHGDFRMDHLVFHPDRPEVLAVLGWKFATLGDPMCDLANNCMSFFLPAHFGARRGLRECDLGHLGIPTAEEYSQMYCSHMGVERPENWNFYLAFAFFRLAVMLQGCHRGSLAGRPAPGDSSPKDAEFVAELAWDFAIKEGFRVFEKLPPTKLLARQCSTWAGQGPLLSRSYSSWARPGAAPVPTAPAGGGPGSVLQGGKYGHPVETPHPLPELQVPGAEHLHNVFIPAQHFPWT